MTLKEKTTKQWTSTEKSSSRVQPVQRLERERPETFNKKLAIVKLNDALNKRVAYSLPLPKLFHYQQAGEQQKKNTQNGDL